MTDRIGVFHGATGMDWAETNASQDIDTYYIPGGIRAFIAGRINFCFECCGLSYTNDTACSSTLAAIHLACNSILNPDGHAGLDRGFFLSRTGNCKTFDDQADGYCRSEGVTTVIIKRLEDAIADNNPILAVILNAKSNHSAESESMIRPHRPAQKANMDMVLNETGVDPSGISYIEMHGTRTQVGDAIEMTSVLDIFAPKVGFRGRSDDEALYLGSAKADIGHSGGSSGMMSMAKGKVLEIPYAFHSSQVDPILAEFEAIAGGVPFHKPSIPILSPLTGKAIKETGHLGPQYLAQHCRQTVNMCAALQNGCAAKFISDKSSVIEISPQPVVSGMIKATLGPQVKTFATLQRRKDTWFLLASALTTLYASGLDIKWHEYRRDFQVSHKVLHLPAYSWDLKEYWIPYVGDWCLTRGEPLSENAVIPVAPAATEAPVKVAPELENTTIHRLVEETVQDQKIDAYLRVELLSGEDLNGIAKGHQVNSIPLTTPSVYAEMALTMGTYLLDRFQPDMADHLVDISNMLVEKALIAHSQGPQFLRTSTRVDWSTKSAAYVFYSVSDQVNTMEHAWCTLKFTDKAELPVFQQKAPGYQSRIDALRKGIMAGDSMRYSQTAGYKLIATLAISIPTIEPPMKLFWTTASFIMNGKDSTDLDIEIYVNHGWDSLQIFEELSPDKSYQTCVRMEQDEESVFKGDTVMFDGDRVVAFFKGLAQGAKASAKLAINPAAALTSAKLSPPKAPPKPEQVPKSPTVGSLAQPTMAKALEKTAAIVQKAAKPEASKKDVVSPALNIHFRGDSFREELGLSLDLESSMFIDFPTLKGLRDYLDPEGEAPEPEGPFSTMEDTVKATADDEAMVSTHLETVMTTHDKVENTVTNTTTEVVVSVTTSSLAASALNIISEESGIALDELTDDTAFAILARFREELAVDLDFNFSIFVDLPTVIHLKKFLSPGGAEKAGANDEAQSSEISFASGGLSTPEKQNDNQDVTSLSSLSSDSENNTELTKPSSQQPTQPRTNTCRPATSVILQGFPRTAAQTLFLLPDGGGSSSSYVPIPKLNADVSPLPRRPQLSPRPRPGKHILLHLGPHAILRHRDPARATPPRRLVQRRRFRLPGRAKGEEVKSLIIIIDSPVLQLVDRLPTYFYEYCDLFGQNAHDAPKYLIPHFRSER
ncbi:MAG: hypothetical protein Q9184_004087 [Pyrenodesmia sp. 2 TL-2023]